MKDDGTFHDMYLLKKMSPSFSLCPRTQSTLLTRHCPQLRRMQELTTASLVILHFIFSFDLFKKKNN